MDKNIVQYCMYDRLVTIAVALFPPLPVLRSVFEKKKLDDRPLRNRYILRIVVVDDAVKGETWDIVNTKLIGSPVANSTQWIATGRLIETQS